jgi:hypothetical protein
MNHCGNATRIVGGFQSAHTWAEEPLLNERVVEVNGVEARRPGFLGGEVVKSGANMNNLLIMRNTVACFKMRWLHLIGAVLWAAVGLCPLMAADDIDKVVQVQSITSEPVGQFLRVKVQLLNTSPQLITAYTLGATVTYGNGQTAQGQITRDMVWVLINEKMGYPPPLNEVFGPGQVTTSMIDVPVEPGASPAGVPLVPTISASVTMVAFADRRALGSSTAIAFLSATRTNSADEANDLAADLDAVKGATDIPTALRELISKVQGEKAAPGLSNARRQRAERRFSALKMHGGALAEHPEALPVMTKAWQIRSEVLRDHSALHSADTIVEKQENNR